MTGSNSWNDVLVSVNHLCEDIHSILEQLALSLDTSDNVLEFLTSQAELLILLVRQVSRRPAHPVCIPVVRRSAHALRVLGDIKPSESRVKTMVKFSLTLLLSIEYCDSGMDGETRSEYNEDLAELSNLCLGHLPVLCHCVMIPELCSVSLASMDLILRKFLTPCTWIPLVKEHLHLRYLVQRLLDKNSYVSSSIVLKFFLTLARVRMGAEMLLTAGFLSSLRVLFGNMVSEMSSSVINFERDASDKSEKPGQLWGLGLAIVTAIIHSLGDYSPCIDIVNHEMLYFFLGKGNLFSYYLDTHGFPSDDLDKKRYRAQKIPTSLKALEETEQTLTLMCALAKHRNSWIKAMKEIDSELREKCIHLLAFISRGINRYGESSGRISPFLCPPELKEEFNCSKKPSTLNSKYGWFALTPACCVSKSNVSAVSTALVVKDRDGEIAQPTSASDFSDAVALQIYRTAFLLLKFLCLQAESASKRSEEVGFVDLEHFPELPMPEILHGLQALQNSPMHINWLFSW